MPLGIFRKRTKTRLADGTKKVIVTDRKGVVRKQKLVKPSGIKEKQKYNKAGDLHTAKLKGPGMRKKKWSGAKGSTISKITTPGYEWAPNPNKKKALKKVDTKKVDTKTVDTKKVDTKKVDTKKVDTKKTTTTTTPKKSQTFKEAFRTNRDAGKKEFTWNKKRYHTRTREEEDARLKKLEDSKKKIVEKKTTPPVEKKKEVQFKHTKTKENQGYYHDSDLHHEKDNTEVATNTKKVSKKKNTQKLYKLKPVGFPHMKQKGGSVKGIGQWAGKSVPGMRYD